MLLEHLQQAFPELSKSQRRLATFLAANYRQVAFMTSSQLAHAVLVHEATVTRFAQQLGYVGYPELLADLRAMIQTELAPGSSDNGLTNDQPISLALQTIASRLVSLDQHLNALAVQQARDLIKNASRVLVLGQGIATPLVLPLVSLLCATGKVASCATGDPFSLASAVVDTGPEQLVIGLSILDDSQEVAGALRFARQQGAHTLAIASSPTSSIAQVAQMAITWLADETYPAATLAVAGSLLAALVLSLEGIDPLPAAARQTRLTMATDMILARRRR